MSDRFVLAHRGDKAAVDPARAAAALWEEEPDAHGVPAATATIFLTNRECPFHCVMCDLWTHTLDTSVGTGVIPQQIRAALATLAPARQLKLYNAGSFFDARAIPPADDAAIAELARGFERVVVESHPAFLTGSGADRCRRFRDLLGGRLEVAVGLETANRVVLARLNKQMTLDSFRSAAAFLAAERIALRVFVQLNPPFQAADDAVAWACRSIDEAAGCGAAVCVVIPTRGGNGAMEALGGAVTQARVPALEAALEYGIAAARCRVFADLWDVDRFADCTCAARRIARLQEMNRTQRVAPAVSCGDCAGRPLVVPGSAACA